MTNPIGVMQGRLSPPADGRIQSFPVDSWREEFLRAREAGLACIEWIYEAGTAAVNPLASSGGIAEIKRLSQRSGIDVRSVCADYFMECRLLTADGRPEKGSVVGLGWLIGQAAQLGCTHIVLPFVDASRLATPEHLTGLAEVLQLILPVARGDLELHLETDLAPDQLAAFLQRMNTPEIRANLDTGNSASLGHDPRAELAALGPWLGSVHIKDRILGGGTVPLGTGDTHFEAYFELFAQLRYAGTYILQAARMDGISEVECCRRNREFVQARIEAAHGLTNARAGSG